MDFGLSACKIGLLLNLTVLTIEYFPYESCTVISQWPRRPARGSAKLPEMCESNIGGVTGYEFFLLCAQAWLAHSGCYLSGHRSPWTGRAHGRGPACRRADVFEITLRTPVALDAIAQILAYLPEAMWELALTSANKIQLLCTIMRFNIWIHLSLRTIR